MKKVVNTITHEEFLSRLYTKYPDFPYHIVSSYIRSAIHIEILTPYGLCKMKPNNLMSGNIPTINSAINKTKYFINQAIEIHGNLYDYSLVDYKNNRTKIKIICPVHGIFKQNPSHHLANHKCKKCSYKYNIYEYKQWEEKGLKSKDFDSFKLYLIKCTDEITKENFYKIGKTFRTIEKRFRKFKNIPYTCEVLLSISNSARKVSETEHKILSELKHNKYNPLLKIDGKTECFKTDDINSIINNITLLLS